MTASSEPDELTRVIADHLQADDQYVEHVDPSNLERIAALRSAGRKAGRLLGWKVRTFQTDPDRRVDGKVVVWVVVEESTPLRDQLREVQGRRKMRQALSNLDWPTGL